MMAALLLLAPMPLHAQNNSLDLGGSNAAAPCVQVQVPGQKPSALNCLNQQLQQQVQQATPAAPAAPLGAGSPSNQVGTFNEQGVREQYGANFGKSAVPQRP